MSMKVYDIAEIAERRYETLIIVQLFCLRASSITIKDLCL